MTREGELIQRGLILGANGSIARQAIEVFLNETDVILKLYRRDAQRSSGADSRRGATFSP